MPGTLVAFRQVPPTSSATNPCVWRKGSTYVPAAAQFPADAHDTIMVTRLPAVLIAARPGSSSAWRQVPCTWSATNPCTVPIEAPEGVYRPSTAQLPADEHDTDRAPEKRPPVSEARPGTSMAWRQVPRSSSTMKPCPLSVAGTNAVPTATQFPADAHDTESREASPKLLNAARPGTLMAGRQLPRTSSAMNAPS